MAPGRISEPLPGLCAISLPLPCKLGFILDFMLEPGLEICKVLPGDVSNLVMNAATFGPRGDPAVNSAVRRKGEAELPLAIGGKLGCLCV